jgi:hypothetical protein
MVLGGFWVSQRFQRCDKVYFLWGFSPRGAAASFPRSGKYFSTPPAAPIEKSTLNVL